MISDTDEYFLEELASVDQQIESCVKEITTFLDKFHKGNKISELSRNKHMQDVHNFLKDLNLLIHESQRTEEFLFIHIVEFRKQNGLCLLPKSSRKCQLCNNSQFDIEGCDTLLLWEQLINHCENFILRELESENKLCDIYESGVNLIRVKCYLNLLQGIYNPEICWTMHLKYRASMIENYTSECGSSCFMCFLKLCIHCICEDQLLVYSGDFYPFPISWTQLLSLYLKTIQSKLQNLITELKQWSKYKNQVPLALKTLLLCKLNLPKYFEMCSVCCLLKDSYVENCTILRCFACLVNPSTNDDFNLLYSSILLQIVKVIYKFELQVDVLVSGEIPITDELHTHEFDLEVVSGGTDFALPSDSPEASPAHENLTRKKVSEENFDSFSKNWRLSIVNNEFLTEMQRLLQKNIQDIIERSMAEERSLLALSKLHLLYGRKTMYNFYSASLEINTVLQSILSCIKELERFLPLLYAAEGPLFPFIASFCHIINTYVVDLLKHIRHISKGSPANFLIYYMYIATSSAVFLQDKLDFYNSLVSGHSESQSESLLKDICEKSTKLAKELKEETFLQSIKYTSCSILFDANSYNFEDTKPFYENERISYSIQMFNLHMKACLSDMQFYLPQKVSQEIYARVLCESLMQLAYRYAHSSPTEARTPLIQADIISLLLCVGELIFPACHISAQFFEKNSEDKVGDETSAIVTRIHSVCCALLSTMAILSSPLPDLYKVFKNGFPVPSLSLRTKYNLIIPWLPWIKPHLFPDCGQSPIMSTVKVWFAVKACTSWLQLHPIAIVKAFTEHYCTLPILIISQASYLSEQNNINQKSAVEVEEQKTKLAVSIYHLLSCYESSSNCLNNIFLPVLERTNQWREFDAENLDKSMDERPWWFKGLFDVFKPYAKSVLIGFLPILRQYKKICAPPDILENWKVLKSKLEPFITCTCNDNLSYYSEDSTVSENSLLFTCFSNLFEYMDDFLILVPLPFKDCLANLDTHFLNYVSEAEPVNQSLPLQILLSVIMSYLKDKKLLSDLIGYSIKEEEFKLITFILESLKSFLLKTENTPNFSKNHIDKIERRLNHIAKHFKDLRKDDDSLRERKKTESLEEELIKQTGRSLLKKSDGIDTLIYLQKLLCLNESWIRTSLGITDTLASDSVINTITPTPLSEVNDPQIPGTASSGSSSKRASLQRESSLGIRFNSGGTLERGTNYDPVTPYLGESTKCNLNLNINEFSLRYQLNFNPLQQFDCLGDCSFKDVMKFTVPWEALLSHLPVLGLTETNFCALLEQRWDVRGEGPVSLEQKDIICDLKKIYDLIT